LLDQSPLPLPHLFLCREREREREREPLREKKTERSVDYNLREEFCDLDWSLHRIREALVEFISHS
jgi:hypothetical protein